MTGIAPLYVRGFEGGWLAAVEFMRSNWPDFMDDAREGESVAETAVAAGRETVETLRLGL